MGDKSEREITKASDRLLQRCTRTHSQSYQIFGEKKTAGNNEKSKYDLSYRKKQKWEFIQNLTAAKLACLN